MKLAPELYQKLFERQGGRCAICRERPSANRRLAMDHCHERDFVRGLLCTRCNTGLSLLEDSFLREGAITYLERAHGWEKKRTLKMVDYNDLMKMELPPVEDWRSCPEPFRKERLLQNKIETMFYFSKMKKNAIARRLRISGSTVERLLRGELRHERPVYWEEHDVVS